MLNLRQTLAQPIVPAHQYRPYDARQISLYSALFPPYEEGEKEG
jgi:hypothetical protein